MRELGLPTGPEREQGPAARRRAGLESVIHYLGGFAESTEREDFWEDHPLLLAKELIPAQLCADDVIKDLLRYLRALVAVEALGVEEVAR